MQRVTPRAIGNGLKRRFGRFGAGFRHFNGAFDLGHRVFDNGLCGLRYAFGGF